MTELVLYLLTHSRELQKSTNTGALVVQALSASLKIKVEVIEWQRKAADHRLLDLSESQQLGLVYPLQADTAQACYLLQQGQYQAQNPAALAELPTRQNGSIKHWVLLDATWQEAAKMLRQSPYLQSCYRLALKPDAPSLYKLRRNQKAGALCTAEVVMELLQQTGCINEKEQLMLLFDEFNKR
ncbi:MAG TPA: tRNA-uridine aminocarboxypropyltransferase [Rheinheimera sp.]|uniref:tRNA-uridine aminocarboxypropyltransferase n=1 Tax=Rheinheimera sp. TaxID=1869214 RepID=UPI002B4A63D7|nr:tRNA-uridine aminocarboxypropyltransferase [Rheinheimera sp.]HJS14647.1 tRNA-uridine aminocarboxypropyltransferase [Rheinheimera sp.]